MCISVPTHLFDRTGRHKSPAAKKRLLPHFLARAPVSPARECVHGERAGPARSKMARAPVAPDGGTPFIGPLTTRDLLMRARRDRADIQIHEICASLRCI